MADYNIVMNKTLRRYCLVGGLVTIIASSAAAESREWTDASSLYGRGVHAYFAGRLSEAETHLSEALALNPDDPRVFYFLALCRMKTGRMDEARSDMELGASLEAQHPGRLGIGTALQRVQGADRLTLEKYRRQAHVNAADIRRQERALVEQRAANETDVLFEQVVVPLQEFLNDGNPRALSAEELKQRAANIEARMAPKLPPQGDRATAPAAAPDPFRDDAAAPTTPPTAAPAAEEPVEEDAFAEEEMPAEEEAPAETEEEPAGEAMPEDSTSSDEDPFGEFN
jgi:hypothetical protein